MQSISSSLLLALTALPLGQLVAAERVLGAYMFVRHGDRTSKSTPPTVLTDLGYREVYMAGSYYHDRYISANSSLQIQGINDELVSTTQVIASAPDDDVLMNSATGFLQGLYPPVGSTATQTLRNGTTVEAPLNGYQLIPVAEVSTGSNSENSAWLQASSDCQKAEVSSNNYFSSPQYNSLLESTKSFYQGLSPMLNRTFTEDEMTYKNAYTIFDYLNVASIHNSSSDFPSADLLTPQVFQQLQVLANIHEYNLAYNASDPVRAILGAVLAGQVVQALNETITSGGKSKLNIQFGAYGTFQSYFGLAQLPAASVNFTGIPDYASSMSWELVTNSTETMPPASDIKVRFLFHNSTITAGSEPTVYPLFGQDNTLLSWSDFVDGTNKFAVSSQEQWCQACGNTDSTCASTSSGNSSSTSSTSGSHHGMSLAVAGVIGAMVTLGVILGLEALFFLLGGFRLAKRRAAGPAIASTVVEDKRTSV
ncbi:histidine phosphatase superfamily [Paecilomyces variotii]|uniref:Histidine phosphatase superfamily n=1 Tax=Byssochlamys spectabilis TaxID=264951 RepID=A0A443HJD3_BYSSP|nr:histidine phosphatase superfamily [Paecilomyces variotii]KAJ9248551.1 hypothetical protein DTO207G8_7330 [Paecilomyces variotii]KAJ9256262.1 hypothetical protein DTO195F2_5987 [Paecilomyces variotii]KAJ9350356.1 hypothetical protein DTO280E4_8678 [Paecilomyces variotii]KAJ9367348.1 hypothetical protein DTO282E5_7996 [Paecilomyces variotii]KAJ9379684.1 hypothetical protein DTO063F5_7055 [Paecilomyces variotii]